MSREASITVKTSSAVKTLVESIDGLASRSRQNLSVMATHNERKYKLFGQRTERKPNAEKATTTNNSLIMRRR